MPDIIEKKFTEWTAGKNEIEARIAIFYGVRDIPYAVVPELNDARNYTNILKLNRGSCTPKHFLLCSLFQKLGLEVLYVVYHYRWDAFNDLYPPGLREPAKEMPTGNHLACKVGIGGNLVLVDATLDPALGKVGLPVNYVWDGIGDTSLPVAPCGEGEIYHPSEANCIQAQQLSGQAMAFYNGLNIWMDRLRS